MSTVSALGSKRLLPALAGKAECRSEPLGLARDYMRISREFIHEHRTARGGWTHAQCHALGESWPPSKGWIERAISKDLTQEQIGDFMRFKSRAQSKKENRRARSENKRLVKAAQVEALSVKLRAGNNWGSPPPSKAVRGRKAIDPNSPEFLESYEWRSLRMEVLAKYGPVCMCCGATREDGEKMHVDHIKPRRKRPDLALTFDNLQVLCGTCNQGKGNWDETDWRPVENETLTHLGDWTFKELMARVK